MRTLITNALVIDPASRSTRQQNVLLEGGSIAALTENRPAADRVLEAAGLALAPGFIDIHMHEDPVKDGHIYADGEKAVQLCMLRMGVTTAIGGNCGDCCTDPGDYLDLVDREGCAVNMGMFAGQSYYRYAAGVNNKYGPATRAQMLQEQAGIRRALERGCIGVSFGIRYVPGVTEEELLCAAAPCGEKKRLLAAHIRDDAEAVFAAAEEFYRLGEKLGVPVQVSHIGSMAGFGQMERFLRQAEERRAAGLDVMCDCYPYNAFSTDLGSTTYDEGWLERYGCDYSVLELCEGRYKGQRCTEEIFREERRNNPDCKTVCHVMVAEQITPALQHPLVMVASDATFSEGQGHPRAAGTFPRVYAQYVRKGLMTLEDAVYKMTLQPAERLGLKRKGRLSPGADADLVLFDPAVIADRASFTEPALAPEGICHVLIGGEFALKDGAVVNPGLGRAIRAE